MGHSYMETGWLRGWRIVRIVIRLRLRRGDYVPVCPAGLQYLAFPSPGVRALRPLPLPLCRHRFPPLVSLFAVTRSIHRLLRSRRRCRCGCRKRKEENSRWLPTVIGKMVVVRSRQNPGLNGSERWEAGNCIRSNHIRERHRALRNQLNGEELVVWREIAGPKRVEGVKEREKAMGLEGPPSRLYQVDEAG